MKMAPILLLAFLLGACGGGPADKSPQGEKSARTQPAAETGELRKVPRNRTLIMDCVDYNNCAGQIKDYASFNPYIPGQASRTGYQFVYEPLYFYNAYGAQDTLIPWIAQSHQYNADYTEVVVKIRPGVKWSDGHPWTAHDLVFTIDMLKDRAPLLLFSTDMKNWVREAVAMDDLTARITLTAPNPRFIFSYFAHNFDNGVPIVPKHIWEGQNPEQFTNFDASRDWPVVSGPYQLALSVPEQRIWDLRKDWWASESGFSPLPQVERIIFLPYLEDAKRVQNLIANLMDTCVDMRPPNIKSALDGNPSLTTWSGRDLPHGYLDWWPVCLGFNNLEAPFSDPQVRWAIDHAIDRRQLIEVGWQGSGSYSLLPFPDFPPLRKYTGQIQDLLERYPVGKYDPQESARIMQARGYARDGEGFWVKGGQRVRVLIEIAPIFQDLTPVLVAQLQKAGFDAGFRNTSDYYDRWTQGTAMAFLFGNGGAVRDPYFTLRLYHSRFVRPTGTATESFWRWSNPEFDRIVDEMNGTDPEDPKNQALFRQAMEVWLRELPSIPLVQWYHRVPHNQTYWTHWPSAENPYINTAYWHRTFLLVLLHLKPTQG
jgi:peptide/nickel transport system substrate-binding protein